MQFTSYLQDGQLTIGLTGEIDHHFAKKYIQAITAKIEAYVPRVCILDFQDVAFMDSSGIAVVINSMRKMSRINGELVLCGLGEQPMKVFTASGIDQLVKIKEVKNEV
jgi:stage II sporulation protein AA (anti-sigma F factor antagonist)